MKRLLWFAKLFAIAVVLLVIAGASVFAWMYFSQPPEDDKAAAREWLEDELDRLEDTDDNELSETDLAVKKLLPDDPDEIDIMRAMFEYRDERMVAWKRSKPQPPDSDGNEAWRRLDAMGKRLREAELPDWWLDEQTQFSDEDREAAKKYVAATDEYARELQAICELGPVVVPRRDLYASVDEYALWHLDLGVMITNRTDALLLTGAKDQAFIELKGVAEIVASVDAAAAPWFQRASHSLQDRISSAALTVIDGVLFGADQTRELLNIVRHTTYSWREIVASHRDEIVVWHIRISGYDDEVLTPVDKDEEAEIGLFLIASWRNLVEADTIGGVLDHEFHQEKSKYDAANEALDAFLGVDVNLFDPDVYQRSDALSALAKEALDSGFLWQRSMTINVTMLKIRLAWLEGKRGEKFDAEVRRIASAVGLDLTIEGSEYTLDYVEGHPLREPRREPNEYNEEEPEYGLAGFDTADWGE